MRWKENKIDWCEWLYEVSSSIERRQFILIEFPFALFGDETQESGKSSKLPCTRYCCCQVEGGKQEFNNVLCSIKGSFNCALFVLSIFRFVEIFIEAWKINSNYWMNLIAFDTFFRSKLMMARGNESNLNEAHCFWSLRKWYGIANHVCKLPGKSSITLSCAMHYSRQRLKMIFLIFNQRRLFGKQF